MSTSQNATSVADIILNKRLVIRKPAAEAMGTPGSIVWKDPAELHIDHESYQRDTNEKHAMKIGSEYRYDRAKVISGFRCPITDIIYVTDGQHSCVGAALAGVPKVPVYVFDLPTGATIKDLIRIQSAQFVAINKNQKKIQKYDEYRNDLLQNDPVATGIQKLCDKHGVTLIPSNKTKGVGTLSHMVSIINSYTQIGESGVDLSLGFIRKYWPNDHVEGPVLMTIARFMKKFEEAKARNISGSQYDPYILFSALTLGGLRTQKEVESLLADFATEARISTYGEMSSWRAKAARHAYNTWVRDRDLGEEKLLSTRVLG